VKEAASDCPYHRAVDAAPPLRPPSVAELEQRIQAERRGEPFLLYRDGDGHQRILMLDPEAAPVTVGRQSDNAVPLEWDSEVSRVHAELVRVGSSWTLADDGLSRNGSYVNDERVTGRRRLDHGDVVQVGRTVLHFRCPSAAESEPTVASPDAAAARQLSAGQRRVLIALCRPFRDSSFATPATNQQIAEELYLSVDAVKSHLRKLFVVFGVNEMPQNAKRSHLAWQALASGVISVREL
jgi:pSer/pThr/pTyr-binding forkhead associated (FHA) protein